MTEQRLETRVYVYCRVFDPTAEESCDELDPETNETRRGHRQLTIISKAAFFATINPYDLMDCPRATYADEKEQKEVKAELDQFDGIVLDTPPTFCEFPASEWEPPEGTRSVLLEEHARGPPYGMMMAAVRHHMTVLGNQCRKAPNGRERATQLIQQSSGYERFSKVLDRRMPEIVSARNAIALCTGLRTILDDRRLIEQDMERSERILQRYIDLLEEMNERDHTDFCVLKRGLLREIRESYRRDDKKYASE